MEGTSSSQISFSVVFGFQITI